MENLIRISAALHRVAVGNCEKSKTYALKAVTDALALNPDITVLPFASLVGASCGDLIKNPSVIRSCLEAVEYITGQTAQSNSYIITSSPVLRNGKEVMANVVIHSGEVISVTPVDEFQPIFDCGGVKTVFISGDPLKLPVYAAKYVDLGVQLIVNTSAVPITVGAVEKARTVAKSFSESACVAVAVCNGNIGESTAPFVYQGFAGVFECGEELVWQVHTNTFFAANADIDIDILNSFASGGNTNDIQECCCYHSLNDKKSILRTVNTNPFLPGDVMESVSVTADYFDLQVRSLVGRLKNAGINKVVIGCSGGLDSTLALLVACAAMEQMLQKNKNIIAVTMPGFGTSDRTHDNSNELLDILGVDKREISVVKSVKQHLEDIDHSLEIHDVTYENAQARERSQILFDLANKENALVLGTGDLSEIALGWCTFGGDHLSSFNVNGNVTKNMARQIVKYLAHGSMFSKAQHVLEDILATPVSPELIPDENGTSPQHTEDIIGSYELHDFFLYYFVKYNMPFSKIYEYACYNFEGRFDAEYILKCLKIFIKRFMRSQFKRSCSSEGAVIGPVSLSPLSYLIPADTNEDYFMAELENSLNKE